MTNNRLHHLFLWIILHFTFRIENTNLSHFIPSAQIRAVPL